MKFEITKEIQEAYGEYVKASEIENKSNNYDGRSKERRAKEKAEKVLKQLLKDDAVKQGKELIERLGFKLDELNVRFDTGSGETFDRESKLNPYLIVDVKPGWYGFVHNISDEEMKVKLLENWNTEHDRRLELDKEKQTLKAITGMLQGNDFKPAWDESYGGREGYYNGNISYYNSDKPYVNMKICPEKDKATIDVQFRFEKISKEKAVEVFAAIQKMIKEVKE